MFMRDSVVEPKSKFIPISKSNIKSSKTFETERFSKPFLLSMVVEKFVSVNE